MGSFSLLQVLHTLSVRNDSDPRHFHYVRVLEYGFQDFFCSFQNLIICPPFAPTVPPVPNLHTSPNPILHLRPKRTSQFSQHHLYRLRSTISKPPLRNGAQHQYRRTSLKHATHLLATSLLPSPRRPHQHSLQRPPPSPLRHSLHMQLSGIRL